MNKDTQIMTKNDPIADDDRIFVALMPTGLWWTDRHNEEHGDYAKLAFLPFSTLELEIFPRCPKELQARIRSEASNVQARRGEPYQISTAGQTVILGYGIAPTQGTEKDKA